MSPRLPWDGKSYASMVPVPATDPPSAADRLCPSCGHLKAPVERICGPCWSRSHRQLDQDRQLDLDL